MDKIIPIDYSNKASWYKMPEVTKEFETFYIYSTIFMGANEGDPDYATAIRDIDADAQLCLAGGTVITNAQATPNEMADLAGPQCYHQDDYSIFYNNIKDNVAKRVAAYKNRF